MPVQFKKDWKSMSSLEWLPGKSLFSLKKCFEMTFNVIWHNMNKTELKRTWRNPNTAYQHKHLRPTVKHCGGGVMIWSYFAATGSEHLAVIGSTMQQWSQTHQQIYNRVTGGKKRSRGCNGLVKLQTSTSLKCCSGTSKNACVVRCCECT